MYFKKYIRYRSHSVPLLIYSKGHYPTWYPCQLSTLCTCTHTNVTSQSIIYPNPNPNQKKISNLRPETLTLFVASWHGYQVEGWPVGLFSFIYFVDYLRLEHKEVQVLRANLLHPLAGVSSNTVNNLKIIHMHMYIQ